VRHEVHAPTDIGGDTSRDDDVSGGSEAGESPEILTGAGGAALPLCISA